MRKIIMMLFILMLYGLSGVFASPARIVGGDDAVENQFAYQAAIRAFGVFICGGSILNNRTILTAAHCIHDYYPYMIEVYVGNNNLNDQREKYEVDEIIVHENYARKTSSNDIALIKLKAPINFHEGVEPIALRRSNIDNDNEVILSGWGSTVAAGDLQKHLQYIHLRTMDVKVCASRLRLIRNVPITDKQLCTFTKKGEGPCKGDSGDPLVDVDGQLVGIVSWGAPCARGFPDVFTRVYSYLGWIENRCH